MNRRHLLLYDKPYIIQFAIEANWLHCWGLRLFDLTWELTFTVWVTTWPNDGCELTTRRNPRGSLRVRLEDEGFPTDFFGDDFVQSLAGHVETVNLADLMETMQMIALARVEHYSSPIVLLDGRCGVLLGIAVSMFQI